VPGTRSFLMVASVSYTGSSTFYPEIYRLALG